jgi:hypothetical protein
MMSYRTCNSCQMLQLFEYTKDDSSTIKVRFIGLKAYCGIQYKHT